MLESPPAASRWSRRNTSMSFARKLLPTDNIRYCDEHRPWSYTDKLEREAARTLANFTCAGALLPLPGFCRHIPICVIPFVCMFHVLKPNKHVDRCNPLFSTTLFSQVIFMFRFNAQAARKSVTIFLDTVSPYTISFPFYTSLPSISTQSKIQRHLNMVLY